MSKLYLLFAAMFTIGVCSMQAQTITTYAGVGSAGYYGDGGPATAAKFNNPVGGVAADASGNLYIADPANSCVRRVSASGIITTFAGGSGSATGDGGQATAAKITTPSTVAVDAAGNVYIADLSNRIRKVTVATGIITTYAGTGVVGSGGDNGPATAAKLNQPEALAFDASGNLYIAEYGNNKVRMVSAAGIITTFAGNGTAASSGDMNPATAAALNQPSGIAVDASGNVFISELSGCRIREVLKSNGNIYTYAGDGSLGTSGDGGAATAAKFSSPCGLAIDRRGNLFVTDQGNNRIRMINAATSIITNVAGNGSGSYFGDGGPATAAGLKQPADLDFDAAGNMYISDAFDLRIRMVIAVPSINIIGGASALCVAKTTTLSDEIPGGTWSSSAPAIATVGSAGVVTGVAAGTATISYKTPTDGAAITVTVVACATTAANNISATPADGLKVYPDPGYGTFNVLLSSPADDDAVITISNMAGVKVRELKIQTNRSTEVRLNAPPGIYFLNAVTARGRWGEKITILN